VLLTLPTGAVDAACFLHLGHVFSSVVTGTMVLLGIAAGSHDPSLAIHCAVALASYTSGVLIGAPIAVRSGSQRMQGAAVRQLGQMSTTYLTGTLTGIVAGLTTRQKPEGLARSLGVFGALIIGALISATVTAHVPRWLPLVVLLPLAVVLVVSRSRPGAGPSRRSR